MRSRSRVRLNKINFILILYWNSVNYFVSLKVEDACFVIDLFNINIVNTNQIIHMSMISTSIIKKNFEFYYSRYLRFGKTMIFWYIFFNNRDRVTLLKLTIWSHLKIKKINEHTKQ